MTEPRAYVYILASQRNGTLYVGVTNDLGRRYFEHVHSREHSFTKLHDVKLLVYAEAFERFEDAIAREKKLKRWNRDWKLDLIEKANPDWQDLSAQFF